MSNSKKEKDKVESQKKEAPLRRFWKPLRSLPAIEWDQKKKKARFRFEQGLFETRDQELAAYLLSKGYAEIGENFTPPAIPPQEDVPDPDSLPEPSFQRLQPGTVEDMRRLGLNVPIPGG